jgi:type IV pilus assembly protein PilM
MSFNLGKISSLLKKDPAPPDSSGVIGVDLGSSSIKIVQLRESKNIATLVTYGELQLGPYDSVEIGRSVRLRPDKLIEAFVDILREATANAGRVSVAISYNASFSAIITLPTDDPDKIATMIPVEARKYVPVPLSDVTVDWFPVSAHGDRKATKVLLAAIHNEALARYEAMIHGADLIGIAHELELFSTIRTVVDQIDETVAVIDFGAGSSKLYVVHKGVLAKAHSVQMNGVDITNAISAGLGIDFRAAEELKRTQGLGVVAGNAELEKTISTILERGFREIHTVMRRYEEEEEFTIQKVILTGGGALLGGLTSYTRDILNVPASLADPFAKVAYPAFLEDTLKEAGPSFAVAVGAAIRGLTQRGS